MAREVLVLSDGNASRKLSPIPFQLKYKKGLCLISDERSSLFTLGLGDRVGQNFAAGLVGEAGLQGVAAVVQDKDVGGTVSARHLGLSLLTLVSFL